MTKKSKASVRKRQARSLNRVVRPSLNLQQVSEGTWYYEHRSHICVVHEVRNKQSGEYIQTEQIRIGWGSLMQSLARCRPNGRGERPGPQGA